MDESHIVYIDSSYKKWKLKLKKTIKRLRIYFMIRSLAIYYFSDLFVCYILKYIKN